MHPNFVICLFAVLAGGCALPTSPLETRARSVSPGQVATLGVGTAAGAVIGKEIGGNTGAVIGGATGLVASALTYNTATASADQRAAELIEQARREERLKIMQDYWYDQTLSPRREATGVIAQASLLNYPAGTYDGIRFAPRQAADSSLAEPAR